MDSQQLVNQEVITELGIGDMPQEMQDEIVVRLGETIFTTIALRTLERFTEAQREEFDQLADSGNPNAAADFARAHIPDYDEMVKGIIRQEVADFKKLQADLNAST